MTCTNISLFVFQVLFLVSWRRNIQGFDNWQWQKLNVFNFYVLICIIFRGKEDIDKMKTKIDPIYISNMYNKQETEIDRDHKPLLCLLPLSSTIPSPQRNCLHPQGHPVPAGPAEPRVTGLDVHRSTGMTANPSGNLTESMTIQKLCVNPPAKGWKKLSLSQPSQSESPGRWRNTNLYVNIDDTSLQQLTEVSIVVTCSHRTKTMKSTDPPSLLWS